jgi:hypothetical protein
MAYIVFLFSRTNIERENKKSEAEPRRIFLIQKNNICKQAFKIFLQGLVEWLKR